MKKNKYMYLCACLLLYGTAASADPLGSSDEDIQSNFNRLVTTKQCPGCNLKGAVLTRMDLREADLAGADLSGAKLSLTNLSKANLKNAVLRGAVLGGADFSGADLRGVDLTDAQLAGAYLKEALLDQKITPEKPYEPEELPEPEEADLSEASAQLSAQEKIILEQNSDTVIPSSEDSEEDKALRPAEIFVDTSDRIEESLEEGRAELAFPESPELPVPSVETVQESGEEKKEAVKLPVLPDIERRTVTTVRSKELVPIAEAQVVDSDQADNLPDALPDTDTAQADKKQEGLDDIPVIDTASEQEKSGSTNEDTELSLWGAFTSLFVSDTKEKKKAEKAAVGYGAAKKAGGLKASELEKEAPVTPAQKLPQPVSNQDKVGKDQQVGAYTVETFGQSRARLKTLIDRLHDDKHCVACDLAGADLTDEDLEEVDLERADLSGAKLERADLRAANLKGVNFTGANLKNADLRKADLYLADFTNADLAGAQLQGALVDSTDFTDAIGATIGPMDQ